MSPMHPFAVGNFPLSSSSGRWVPPERNQDLHIHVRPPQLPCLRLPPTPVRQGRFMHMGPCRPHPTFRPGYQPFHGPPFQAPFRPRTQPFRMKANFNPLFIAKNLKSQRSPENASETKERFFCEVCDRSFPTKETLQVHLESHEQCQFDGCSYSASPNLVVLHVKFQHNTGLFQKIPWNSNSEAIEKWRAERKKKYPTIENVERKMAELKEKNGRGEVIKDHWQTLKAKGKRRKRTPNHVKKKERQVLDVESSFISRIGSLANIKEEPFESKVESDEEWKDTSIAEKHENTSPLLLGKALSIISDVYGSGSDDEGGKEENPKAPHESWSDDERPEEVSSVVVSQLPSLPDSQRSRRKRRLPLTHVKRTPYLPHKKIRKPTLLQMLLKDDIRKERNCLLQCIRFIKKTHFLKTLNDNKTGSKLQA